jgi:tetratricopeptide (TPR) repeat protein
MAHVIFISLTQQDTEIAEALRTALTDLLGDILEVHFSTSKEAAGGIRHGQDWFQWIVEEVQHCDFALILLTPASVQKPWILWEAGAVHGAAIASGQGDLRKVRPLVFQVDSVHLPSPIKDSKAQYRRGDRLDDVSTLFTEILDQYGDELKKERYRAAVKRLDNTVETYLKSIQSTLLKAPMLPTPEVIEEWRIRLDEVLKRNRASEVEHLHDWLDIAFGREREEQPRPLDLRIHGRLADLYIKSRNYRRAIEQLELSRQLAPRDIYVLRQLGKAYLDSGDRGRAKAVIDRIDELDSKALVHNAEYAALAARWYREGGNHAKAAEILRAALDDDRDSYYLANLLGEVALEGGQEQAGREAFKRALDIIARLRETNIWTHATAANAAFVLGNDELAAKNLKAVAETNPDAGALGTIEAGLDRLAKHVERGNERVLTLRGALIA